MDENQGRGVPRRHHVGIGSDHMYPADGVFLAEHSRCVLLIAHHQLASRVDDASSREVTAFEELSEVGRYAVE